MTTELSYFRKLDHINTADLNDYEDHSAYLIVNCAGHSTLPEPFHRILPGGRNDYYLMYLTSGTLSITVGDKAEKVLLTPGRLFVFPPHTYFQYYNATDDTIQYLWVHFTGQCAGSLLSACRIPLLSPCLVGFPDEAEEKFQALFKTFLVERAFLDVSAPARLMDLCVLFGQIILQNAGQGSSIPDGQQTQRLYTSLSFLHEHYSQPLSISALAAMETLSVSRYRMLFHEIFGISPITYLTRLRMRQALTLLLQTNLPISHISSSVGYEDPLYFSRAFRRMFGLSPTDYRNLHTHK